MKTSVNINIPTHRLELKTGETLDAVWLKNDLF